jgi:hypothetical protein
MESVKANVTLKGILTKDKEYLIVSETENQYQVIDDEGFKIGFSKSYFKQDNIKPFEELNNRVFQEIIKKAFTDGQKQPNISFEKYFAENYK